MSTANIEEYLAGDSLVITFQVQRSDGSPQDLTSCQIVWGVSRSRDLTAPLITKSNGTGIIVVDEVSGICTATVNKGELIATGDLFHELEITLPSGRSYTYIQGTINSIPTVYPN
jgi:hypothetical protein